MGERFKCGPHSESVVHPRIKYSFKMIGTWISINNKSELL
jgi:hypothetical protein